MGVVSNQVEVVQTMVDHMKTALEEAQANLTIAQSRAKSQVDRSRRNEKFEVGDEVVLSTRHISVNQHLPSKFKEALDWTLPSRQGDFSSGVWIGFGPSLADPSCLPCVKPQKVQVV